jgi:glycosyltransferase involved in cell wall biosynthesis
VPPLRLLHVIQRYYPFEGGSERYFLAFSERFVRRGDVVDVLTSDAWDLEYFWDPARRKVSEGAGCHAGVSIHRLPVRHLPFARVTHRGMRRLMAESCRVSFPGRMELLRKGARFGPWLPLLSAATASFDDVDLVNSANIAFESMVSAAASFASSRDVPHIVTPFLHLGEGPNSRVRRYYTMPHQLELLRRADGVLALTTIEAEYLASAGIRGERLFVVGASIDAAAVTGGDGRAIRARLGIEGPIVLALGAAAFDKGTVHLVEAVALLNRAGRELSLVVAGPVLAEFQTFIESLRPEDRRAIHVLGFVGDDEKRDLLAACDIVALPSRTESFGLVFPEAWANGKPVVGARAGAIPAVIDDGRNGLLVEFGDVKQLAGALDALAADETLRARLASAGAAAVVDEPAWYDLESTAYDHVLGASGGQPAEGNVDTEKVLAVG